MKQCSKCNLSKSLSDFYFRKTGSRVNEYYEKCKDCYRARGRIYYNENREKQLKLALLRKSRYKEERRKFIAELKYNKPCMDCKKIFPTWVMDFDHRDGAIKIGSVSRMAVTDTSSFEKIKIEIAKCDLVCANCHRQRTHDRILKQNYA